jgi:hypothetical protein
MQYCNYCGESIPPSRSDTGFCSYKCETLTGYECVYCERELPEAHSECCGEVGHTQPKGKNDE